MSTSPLRVVGTVAVAVMTVVGPAFAQPSGSSAVRWHLDAAFGSGGFVLEDPGAHRQYIGRDVAVQDDGKIVVAGELQRFYPPKDRSNVFVARFQENGTLDPSFGSAGFVVAPFGRTNDFGGLALTTVAGRPKIVVTGHVYERGPDPQHRVFVLRLTRTGRSTQPTTTTLLCTWGYVGGSS
jgi:hypothetical protein